MLEALIFFVAYFVLLLCFNAVVVFGTIFLAIKLGWLRGVKLPWEE